MAPRVQVEAQSYRVIIAETDDNFAGVEGVGDGFHRTFNALFVAEFGNVPINADEESTPRSTPAVLRR